MNCTDTPWMDEPIAWTGQAQDNASQYDPRRLEEEEEEEEENFRRQYAATLAEAWDEAHTEDQARQREAEASTAAHQAAPHT